MKTQQKRDLAALESTLQQVVSLAERKAGWDGYDALAPDAEATARAEMWLRDLYHDVQDHGQVWLVPHVTASAGGEVVLEWWKGPKKLTVYLSADEASFVQVWGPDIVADMAEGDASSAASRQTLWAWLTS